MIGLGYVGLPLCLAFAKSGYRVLGVDVDAADVIVLVVIVLVIVVVVVVAAVGVDVGRSSVHLQLDACNVWSLA